FRRKPMPIIGDDPKFQMLQDFDQLARASGHPGPPTPAAAEVEANWIVPLMIGRAVQGGTTEEAIDWATQRVETIYAKYKKPRAPPGIADLLTARSGARLGLPRRASGGAW